MSTQTAHTPLYDLAAEIIRYEDDPAYAYEKEQEALHTTGGAVTHREAIEREFIAALTPAYDDLLEAAKTTVAYLQVVSSNADRYHAQAMTPLRAAIARAEREPLFHHVETPLPPPCADENDFEDEEFTVHDDRQLKDL